MESNSRQSNIKKVDSKECYKFFLDLHTEIKILAATLTDLFYGSLPSSAYS